MLSPTAEQYADAAASLIEVLLQHGEAFDGDVQTSAESLVAEMETWPPEDRDYLIRVFRAAHKKFAEQQ